MIPESDGMITPQIVDMITELVETQENPLATRKRFFLIEGPAGVGKSFNARMFAELNERPFVVQTLPRPIKKRISSAESFRSQKARTNLPR